MSWKLLGRAEDLDLLSPLETLIMYKLCKHAKDDGLTWPGREGTAKWARCSEKSVSRVMRKFSKDGSVEMVQKERPGNARHHQIHMDVAERLYRSSPLQDPEIKGDTMSPIPDSMGDISPSMGDTGGHNAGHGESHEDCDIHLERARGTPDGAPCASPAEIPSKREGVSEPTGAETETHETLILRWRRLKPWVQDSFGTGTWQSWFEKMLVAAITDDEIHIEAPSTFYRDEFRKTYAPAVEDRTGLQIKITVSERAYAKAHPQPRAAATAAREKSKQAHG